MHGSKKLRKVCWHFYLSDLKSYTICQKHDVSYSREILHAIFCSITLSDASLSFKVNGNFRHNYIAIYDFKATWFSFSFSVSTLLFIYDSIYIEKCSLFICCVDISVETWLKNDCIGLFTKKISSSYFSKGLKTTFASKW